MPVENVSIDLGVPIKRSKLWVGDSIQLVDTFGRKITNLVFEPSSLWPDKSIKWLRLRFVTSFENNQSIQFNIEKYTPVIPACLASIISNTNDELIVNTASGDVTFNKKKFLCLSLPCFRSTGINIKNLNQEIVALHEPTFHYVCSHNNERYLYVDIEQQLTCESDEGFALELTANISVELTSGLLDFRFTVRNPKAAEHDGGQWDLGDKNSALIKSISWVFDLAGSSQHSTVHLTDKKDYFAANQPFSVHQASSGFEHWNSTIHVNKHNKVDLPFKGYRVNIEGSSQYTGEQASPILTFGNEHNQQSLLIEDFWQNFPSALVNHNDRFELSLLGTNFESEVELQPGEQKSRRWKIGSSSAVTAKIDIILDPNYLSDTRAIFSHLQPSTPPLFNDLIELGTKGRRNFFAKRRTSDSYGWRHFGELHADHETALTPDIDTFVSHYNNQYDPIYGMLIQWFKTGEGEWFELADKLAKHVADIDVYHTHLDKPDYNGGLFWHTDHYVQAYTATHRTYSTHQPSDVYDDHAGGGGPGGQHCYTQGLTLHYFLTAHKPSLDASLKISKWIEILYEGDNTFVAMALALKNRHRGDLKNIISGCYPLDRGTGNYIQSLLDTYELTGKASYIEKVEHVISSTISYADDMALRQLDNVENTWFYTVFLQAVCRYLYVAKDKYTHRQDTQKPQLILLALRHYVEWMIEHEYLYLDKPDILEFANQTWTAQDLRKLCIINFTTPFLSQPLQHKAKEKLTVFAEGIASRLKSSEETQSTRVLCLLMQNGHSEDYAVAGKQTYEWLSTTMSARISRSAQTDVQLDTLSRTFIRTLKNVSIEQERLSLVKRFPSLSKWFGAPN